MGEERCAAGSSPIGLNDPRSPLLLRLRPGRNPQVGHRALLGVARAFCRLKATRGPSVRTVIAVDQDELIEPISRAEGQLVSLGKARLQAPEATKRARATCNVWNQWDSR